MPYLFTFTLYISYSYTAFYIVYVKEHMHITTSSIMLWVQFIVKSMGISCT